MIRAKKGEIVMKGDAGAVITDFLGICSGFIGYLEDKFKCDEEEPANGMSMFANIAMEDYSDFDEDRSAAKIRDTLNYLLENEKPEPPETIVIKATSLEDASEQLGEVLKKILEKAKTEGDK